VHDGYFVERKLYPNVDFYSGIIYRALGFHETCSPSCSPSPGRWMGRALDGDDGRPQAADQSPRQVYDGVVLRDYVRWPSAAEDRSSRAGSPARRAPHQGRPPGPRVAGGSARSAGRSTTSSTSAPSARSRNAGRASAVRREEQPPLALLPGDAPVEQPEHDLLGRVGVQANPDRVWASAMPVARPSVSSDRARRTAPSRRARCVAGAGGDPPRRAREQPLPLGPRGGHLGGLRPLPLIGAAISLRRLASGRVDARQPALRQQAHGLRGDQVTQSLAFAL